MIIKIIVPTSNWACATLHSLGTVLCVGLLKLSIWRGTMIHRFHQHCSAYALPTCHDSAVPCVRRYLELDEHTGTLVIWNQRPPLSLVYKIEDWAAADSQVGQELRTWIVKWCWMTLDDVVCWLMLNCIVSSPETFADLTRSCKPKATLSLVAVIRTRTKHFQLIRPLA